LLGYSPVEHEDEDEKGNHIMYTIAAIAGNADGKELTK
jgi:hypothetical protein